MWTLALLQLLVLAPGFAADDACDGAGDLRHGGRLDAADLVIEGTGAGVGLGSAVAVGDFDGDGAEDLAIGVPGDDPVSADAGSVLLFYGPISRSSLAYRDADVRINGTAGGGRFGASLASLGDIDADGRDDLLIGAPGSPTAVERRGYAVVLYGRTSFPLVTTWSSYGSRLLGAAEDDRFGAAVAAIGDVDQDGTPDFAIGAPGSDAGAPDAGAVSVWLDWARVRADSAPDQVITGTRDGALLGTAVSAAGDINGDGWGDFAFGAPADNLYSNRAGAVGIWFGTPLLVPVATFDDAHVRLIGETGSELGAALAAAGDVDGDGADDLWVGAPNARPDDLDASGSIYLVAGGVSLIGDLAPARTALSRFDGPPGSRFGAAIAAGLDVNGDAVFDVAVGGPDGRVGTVRSGLVWVLGSPFGIGHRVAADTAFVGDGRDGRAGASLVFATQLGGDGLPDLVVGSPDMMRSDPGRVHLVHGGLDLIDAVAWYSDADGDGWGSGTATTACAKPPGAWADQPGDCADANAARHPGASEARCDGVDYNCDGSIGATDFDGDGFNACHDCDDVDPLRHPDASERCNDLDDDCDGVVDESPADGRRWFPDDDGDGFGRAADGVRRCESPGPDWVLTTGDCDDDRRSDSPAGVEVCDGRDNDCDGRPDDNAIGAYRFFADADNDGWGDWRQTRWACVRPAGFATRDGDCDDTRRGVNPDAIEVCNYRDDDCDGMDYLGGPRSVADARLAVGGDGGAFGVSVAFIPDWDGDGRDEVAIAAPGEGSVEARTQGAVYIRSGDPYGGREDLGRQRADGSFVWDARVVGPKGTAFAESLAVGDFDDDGAADLAIGAKRGRGGTVYVFYGPLAGDYRIADGVSLRADAGAGVGTSLAAGDVTGDGVADLLVGAPGTRRNGATGMIAVLRGGARWASGSLDRHAVQGYGQDGDKWGTTIDFVGDVTGDGIGDFGTANPRAADFLGLMWVFPGGSMTGGFPAPAARIAGAVSPEHPGKSMAGLDFDGDGDTDLALGSPRTARTGGRAASSGTTSG